MTLSADLDFCQKIPKVELHAHLNGSISEKTFSRLLHQSSSDATIGSAIIGKGKQRTMAECFQMFHVLHQVVCSPQVVTNVLHDVIEDFADDGVKYLELRSTPRDVASSRMTKSQYIETVLSGIQQHRRVRSGGVDVRYLPSIDKGRSVEEAMETVKLVEEKKLSVDDLIVGIDFSGNPYANIGVDYTAPLLYAKRCGLKLTVHAAEIDGVEQDTARLLALPPDRIGHGTYLKKDEAMCNFVLSNRIPLEICITSNVKTCTAPSDYTQHHMSWWRQEHGHPCSLGTDDKGVFSTTLSNEYVIAATALKLSQTEVFEWSEQCIDHIFADQNTKKELRRYWKDYKDNMCHS